MVRFCFGLLLISALGVGGPLLTMLVLERGHLLGSTDGLPYWTYCVTGYLGLLGSWSFFMNCVKSKHSLSRQGRYQEALLKHS